MLVKGNYPLDNRTRSIASSLVIYHPGLFRLGRMPGILCAACAALQGRCLASSSDCRAVAARAIERDSRNRTSSPQRVPLVSREQDAADTDRFYHLPRRRCRGDHATLVRAGGCVCPPTPGPCPARHRGPARENLGGRFRVGVRVGLLGWVWWASCVAHAHRTVDAHGNRTGRGRESPLHLAFPDHERCFALAPWARPAGGLVCAARQLFVVVCNKAMFVCGTRTYTPTDR